MRFEDSIGQIEYPCLKCGKFCYLSDDITKICKEESG